MRTFQLGIRNLRRNFRRSLTTALSIAMAGNAGITTAASQPNASAAVWISSAALPRNVESIFLNSTRIRQPANRRAASAAIRRNSSAGASRVSVLRATTSNPVRSASRSRQAAVARPLAAK